MSYISWWKLWIPIWTLVGKIQAKPQRDASNHIGDPNHLHMVTCSAHYYCFSGTKLLLLLQESSVHPAWLCVSRRRWWEKAAMMPWAPDPEEGEGERGSWEQKRLPHITWVVTCSYGQCSCHRNRTGRPATLSQDDARDQGLENRSILLTPAFLHLQFLFFTCGRTCCCGQHKECLQTYYYPLFLPRPYLDCKFFHSLFVTSNLWYMHGVLNVDKKITNYIVWL